MDALKGPIHGPHPFDDVPVGTECPDFSLPDPRGGAVARDAGALGEHGLLVMFICNHCPFVVHRRRTGRTGPHLPRSGRGHRGDLQPTMSPTTPTMHRRR